ncbi:MAG: efflux transporter outer membrane subunit [Burkholderiaceae bacterium]
MNPCLPSDRIRPAFRQVVMLACAVLVSGCASLAVAPGPAVTDLALPSAWHAGTSAPVHADATALADWWQRFNDPVLTRLVTQALQANTTVQGARSALQQARAQADVQRAGLGPRLDASASAQRSRSGSNDAANRFQAGVDASWEPDIFGGNRSAARAGDADAEASAASLATVQVSLAAEVAVKYIELRGLQARLAIARDNLSTQDETLQLTRWRAQAGLVSSLDVEQAVNATEQTRAQIPALQTSVSQTLNALAVLTDRTPGAPDTALNAAAPIPPAPADLALSFPADTLRQRPDVRSAELRATAALERVGEADAARYPSLQLSGSLGLSALGLGALGNSASLLQALLASVSVPLFDGGAGKAQVRVQQAALEQARSTYRAAVLTALQDVEDALVALSGDRERLEHLQAASSAAANAELLARQNYSSGLVDFTTVLTTQRSLLSAQDSLASTQASLIADHVRLYKALGGGWRPDADADSDDTAQRSVGVAN